MEDVKKLLGSVAISPKIIEETDKGVKDIEGFKNKIEEYLSQNVTELLDVILYGAIALDTSDIHVEPEQEKSRLRIRLDGILQDVVFFDRNIYRHLISRLKLLSKLKLNITDKPQDGRFTIGVKDLLIEIRTSSLPAEYGESIVMRILNPKSLISLEDLGLREDLYKIFQKEIEKPNGMIIVTGPTGSGKTTTLYAFLKKIQNPEIKIITIEDPIEYHLAGVSQTQVAPEKGYDFSDGLKSIVRQDPDVILVGEIRDLETAKIALQASLTGHLVLSTLHTNDAAGTIPRLVDIGTDASSIASGLKMAIAQRLVRKICPKCKAKKGGCEYCNFTEYKGRMGLYEVLLVDAEMEKFILTNPPVSEIKKLAIQKGMVTMYQSGLLAVKEKKTTLQEVKRVVEEDESL
ncbi:MAG: hypothetical protein A2358_04485 [Candidatus Staskawiczbacteria bacterium RIFOXYB1_FULL_37_44]|uniref:Bacterial type II secretion system protein E domain-containing protein n=1 Tax=Candidatus Staskawiczbacteria bacterium RIFOXYB1_FULL_37_44 TaxID=1802223 RepID=A0A1G2IX90_9BACT|nr:MAG: hypothetical protein A2358_04485 [Candidatus Staskawiczbacteria bacterium RIFOXYB1_FULL_37_44]OGZ83970.1 MAG: hypothetical protein A2416_04315 [Candidatus Staskawiczbacteria bacterium RIFOXYC1_FULL_37_52]OGZ89540.1 MAG: hypothetical protein A2581_03695 [Candidatus Staskawiczbacteria bacterium RIFOXYD1_FULL_37_110]